METFSRGTHGPLEPWYVTGLAEGIGVFTYSKSGRQIALYFAMKLAADKEGLLEALAEYFEGAGKIYSIGTGGSRYYRVCRRSELERIVDHFDRYPLRGAKAEVYGVWREMVAAKRDFRKPDRERLAMLAAELTLVSRRQ